MTTQRKAVCYALRDSSRSKHVAMAMAAGLTRHGWHADVIAGYNGVRADLAIGYGWIQKRVFDAYRASGGSYLYVDMGYWNRKPKHAPRDGHHKVVANAWCPARSMRRGMPDTRINALGVKAQSAAPQGSVLVAGMSGKSAIDHGYAIEQWERDAISQLTKAGHAVTYRPKPSWEGAKPIEGAAMSDVQQPISDVLTGARAVVTHHSNTAVDALTAGLPYYCEAGAALALSCSHLLATPTATAAPEEARKKLLSDIAWLQWTPEEMRSGACWDYYKGLI